MEGEHGMFVVFIIVTVVFRVQGGRWITKTILDMPRFKYFME